MTINSQKLIDVNQKIMGNTIKLQYYIVSNTKNTQY